MLFSLLHRQQDVYLCHLLDSQWSADDLLPKQIIKKAEISQQSENSAKK